MKQGTKVSLRVRNTEHVEHFHCQFAPTPSHINTPPLDFVDILSFFYVPYVTNTNKAETPLQYHEEKMEFLLLINKIGCNLLHNYGIYNDLKGGEKW